MTSPAAGTPDDESRVTGQFGTPSINYAQDLADEIVEIQSQVTEETKEEASASLSAEKTKLENERLRIEVKMLEADLAGRDAKNKDRENTTKLRGDYAEKAYNLALGSLSFWVVIVAGDAVVNLAGGPRMLSDNILIAVTTGCTVNVLAAFLGVIRGLFPARPQRSKKSAKKRAPKP